MFKNSLGQIIFRFRILLVVAVLLALTSCASPPDQDFSALRSADFLNPDAHGEYIAQQQVALTGVPFVSGNRIQLLKDGNATLPAMLAAIKQARHYIYMESFTFDAKAGKTFAEAMIARRHAGVKVGLIYDAFGSSDTPPGIFDYLRRNGVTLVEYNPIGAIDIIDGNINYRDHRKILIIDGKTAFIGGVNISVVYLHKQKLKHEFSDGYDGDDYKHLPWRDTHIKITGPSVREFEHIYQHTWHDQHGSPDALSAVPLNTHPNGKLAVAALMGEPYKDEFSVYESLRLAITLAQHSVYLTTAYFVPTPGLKDVLIAAARRGVEVQLLLPSTSDSDLALAAGHADYRDLIDAGVKIYEFQNEVLHAKTAVIDGVWSTVGSSNLDWRSAAINNECNAVILGSAFGNKMNTMFQEDLAHSRLITAEEWDNRPIGERLEEFKASLVDYFL